MEEEGCWLEERKEGGCEEKEGDCEEKEGDCEGKAEWCAEYRLVLSGRWLNDN